jgi:sigma-B regulation protein RsbU (phosphoserine phosphatase)
MTTAPGSLLLVDDDDMLRGLLARYLEGQGFRVRAVADGSAALAEIEKGIHELVLLDVVMEDGLSGLDVLRRIRQTHSPTDLPVILATAKDQPEDEIQGLELGANDYVSKPFTYSVVRARVETQLSLKRSVDQIRQLEQSLAQRNADLEAVNRRMKTELERATLVQKALLPSGLPPLAGANFAWQYRPCTELAGDLLNIIPLDERRVALYVLDVAGHGVAAALLAVMVNRVLTRFRLTGQKPALPAEVANQLNREFPWNPDTGQYFTLQYGILELDTGVYRFATAGHPGPAYVPHDDGPRNLRLPSSWVGLAETPYEEHTLLLRPGDRLCLYSDGIPEAENAKGEPFRTARLLASLDRTRGLPLSESIGGLLRDVESWCAPTPPRDDISVLAVERTVLS